MILLPKAAVDRNAQLDAGKVDGLVDEVSRGYF